MTKKRNIKKRAVRTKKGKKISKKQKGSGILDNIGNAVSSTLFSIKPSIENTSSVCAPDIVPSSDMATTHYGKNMRGAGSPNTPTTAGRPTIVVTKTAVHKNSCLTKSAVLKLANAWNNHVKKNPGKSYKVIKGIRTLSPDKLWMELRDRLTGDKNEPEDHWLKNPIVTNELTNEEIEKIREDHYRPEAPKEWHFKKDTWLSTIDIEKLLEQYEDKYPEFKSYGASPIDFDLKGKDIGWKKGQAGAERCLVNPLCNINLRELTNRDPPIKFIGVVFNLDPHNKSGSHWISMFVNLPKQEINFWDSYGYIPPPEVAKLMKRIQKQAQNLGMKNCKCQVNKVRHQLKQSECGMYSSWFIIEQLEGRSFKEVCNNIVTDDEMNAKRMHYFNY